MLIDVLLIMNKHTYILMKLLTHHGGFMKYPKFESLSINSMSIQLTSDMFMIISSFLGFIWRELIIWLIFDNDGEKVDSDTSITSNLCPSSKICLPNLSDWKYLWEYYLHHNYHVWCQIEYRLMLFLKIETNSDSVNGAEIVYVLCEV